MEADVVWEPEKKRVSNQFSKKESQGKLDDTLKINDSTYITQKVTNTIIIMGYS